MMSIPKSLIVFGFACATGALSVGACAPSGAYVEVDYAPPNVVAYPHVIYAGRPTYYVDGRWYYRDGPRWVYYSDPPARLREYHYERALRASPERRYAYQHDRHEEARRREYERERREQAHHREYEHDRHEAARREDTRRAEHERARRESQHGRREVESAPPAERVR
jgi:hypothetical protein